MLGEHSHGNLSGSEGQPGSLAPTRRTIEATESSIGIGDRIGGEISAAHACRWPAFRDLTLRLLADHQIMGERLREVSMADAELLLHGTTEAYQRRKMNAERAASKVMPFLKAIKSHA